MIDLHSGVAVPVLFERLPVSCVLRVTPNVSSVYQAQLLLVEVLPSAQALYAPEMPIA